MSEKISDPVYLANVQYANPDNLMLRRSILEFMSPRIDIHKNAVDSLKLDGNESILEVGCGDGSVLLNLRKERKHNGRLVGVDISKGMFEKTNILQKELGLKPIEFIQRSADNLPFPDNSFDYVLSFFMLYHMPDIRKTLTEWKRVLKPGGKLIVATLSEHNRPKLQLLKVHASDSIGKKAPLSFSSRFNLENGRKILSPFFTDITEQVYKSEIRLPYPEPYIAVFTSIRDFFDVTDSEWEQLTTKVKEIIEKEIKEKGHFSDTNKSGFFICKKI